VIKGMLMIASTKMVYEGGIGVNYGGIARDRSDCK
jgi:hypothetical protein